MSNNQVIISRIQNRRGLKQNLPQPLLPGEIALTVDTGELWIGTNTDQPPYGVRTYTDASGDISTAESIADTQIASIKFLLDLTQGDFDSLLSYLTGTPTPAMVLTDSDILWDGASAVFIACDITVDAANTLSNAFVAIKNSPLASNYDAEKSGALSTINQPYFASSATSLTFADANPDTITYTAGSGNFVTDGFYAGQEIYVSGTTSNDGTYTIDTVTTTTITLIITDSLTAETSPATLRGRTDPATTNAFNVTTGEFQFTSTYGSPNAQQGANAAILMNSLNGAQLVTTFGNLQITTTGVGVGSPTFRDFTVTDSDSGYSWNATGTASADSTVDVLTLVSGTDINIDVDPTSDAIRISSTAEQDPDKLYTGFLSGVSQFNLVASTAAFTDIPGLTYNVDSQSDVSFLKYSLNVAGSTAGTNNYTVNGTMRVVTNNLVGTGTSTLVDDQIEVRDSGLTGDISFQAVYHASSPNFVQIQYKNTFATDATMRVVVERWESF